MGKRFFGILLFVALIVEGCASPQWHQSLLIHENQQLENALYMAQSRAVELKRENDRLRKKQGTEDDVLPMESDSNVLDEELELAPPVEVPKVILPSQPGTTEVPDSLKGAEIMPLWHPRR